jgi:NodT family efflux transporter outer membrane factor (OMF) lipoprotein
MPAQNTITIASLVILAGTPLACKVGPDYKRPDSEAPTAYAGLDSSATNLPSTPVAESTRVAAWWSQFNDPALTSLIERASAGNLPLAQAESRVRQARAARDVAASALYPELDASAAYSRNRSGSSEHGFTFASTSNSFRAGFDASWEIDLFGGTRRAVEAADAQVQSAVNDRASVMVSLAGEVATNYLSLRGTQRQLAIARENLIAQQQTLDLTQQRFDAGFVSALDVANARATVAQTSSQIPSFEAQSRASIYALGVLLGQSPESLLAELSPDAPVPNPPSTVPIGLPSELLERRPDIRKADADLHAATARIGVAVADQYPRFSLTGSLGTQGDRYQSLGTIANRFWSIGPSVSLPLFTGGRIKGNIEETKEAANQALLAYRLVVLTALQDVETSLTNFTHEQQRRAALIETVDANRQAADLSLQLYSAGRTDFLNVLSAQRQLYSSQASLSQSDTNVGQNLVALYKALGGGWNAPGETITPPPSPPQPASPPTAPSTAVAPARASDNNATK